MPQTIRVASFNTENLFSRAKVLNLPDDAVISAELEKIRELDALLRKSAYDAATKKRIIVLYGELREFIETMRELCPNDVYLGLRQKGVDMRIGLDIASMTLKHQVDTLILVTGDSDFVPAAKLARREGVEFLLDPLWQQVSDELNEHVDGVVSVFPKPAFNGQSLIAA